MMNETLALLLNEKIRAKVGALFSSGYMKEELQQAQGNFEGAITAIQSELQAAKGEDKEVDNILSKILDFINRFVAADQVEDERLLQEKVEQEIMTLRTRVTQLLKEADAQSADLEEQSEESVIEQINSRWQELVRQKQSFIDRLNAAFGEMTTEIQQADIAERIAQYERNPHGERDEKKFYDLTEANRVLMELKNRNSIFDDDTLAEIIYELKYINEYGQSEAVRNLVTDEVRRRIQEIREKLSGSELNSTQKYRLRLESVALLREVMYRASGKMPNSTQVMSGLLAAKFPNNLTMQINTGEGKSLINPILAALQWLDGNTVNVLTANAELAKRDFSEAEEFWECLGIQASVLQKGSKHEEFNLGGINYTTASDFALFTACDDLNSAEPLSKNPKLRLVGLYDEADLSFFESKTSFNYSQGLDANTRSGYRNPHAWFYFVINDLLKNDSKLKEALQEFLKANSQKRGELISNIVEYTRKTLSDSTSRLSDIVPEAYLPTLQELTEEKKFCQEVSNDQLLRWLTAATNATQLKEGTHFVVSTMSRKEAGKLKQYRQIQLLSASEKHVVPGAQFADGVHQFLSAQLAAQDNQGSEAKPFVIDYEIMSVESSSDHSELSRYQKILGITGTIGDRRLIAQNQALTGAVSIVIPPHHRNQRYDRHAQFCKSSEEQLSQLFKALTERCKGTQIVFGRDGAQCKQLFEKLKAKFNGQPVDLIFVEGGNYYKVACDGAQEVLTYDTAIKAASEYTPGRKTITVATPIFGRGVNIKNLKRLIMAYFEPNDRTLGQCLGRTARYGAKGETLQIYDWRNERKIHHKDLAGSYDRKACQKEASEIREKMLNDEIMLLDRFSFITRSIEFYEQKFIDAILKVKGNVKDPENPEEISNEIAVLMHAKTELLDGAKKLQNEFTDKPTFGVRLWKLYRDMQAREALSKILDKVDPEHDPNLQLILNTGAPIETPAESLDKELSSKFNLITSPFLELEEMERLCWTKEDIQALCGGVEDGKDLSKVQSKPLDDLLSQLTEDINNAKAKAFAYGNACFEKRHFPWAKDLKSGEWQAMHQSFELCCNSLAAVETYVKEKRLGDEYLSKVEKAKIKLLEVSNIRPVVFDNTAAELRCYQILLRVVVPEEVKKLGDRYLSGSANKDEVIDMIEKFRIDAADLGKIDDFAAIRRAQIGNGCFTGVSEIDYLLLILAQPRNPVLAHFIPFDKTSAYMGYVNGCFKINDAATQQMRIIEDAKTQLNEDKTKLISLGEMDKIRQSRGENIDVSFMGKTININPQVFIRYKVEKYVEIYEYQQRSSDNDLIAEEISTAIYWPYAVYFDALSESGKSSDEIEKIKNDEIEHYKQLIGGKILPDGADTKKKIVNLSCYQAVLSAMIPERIKSLGNKGREKSALEKIKELCDGLSDKGKEVKDQIRNGMLTGNPEIDYLMIAIVRFRDPTMANIHVYGRTNSFAELMDWAKESDEQNKIDAKEENQPGLRFC